MRHDGQLRWTQPANARITRWRRCISSDTNSTHSSPRPNVPSPSIPTTLAAWAGLGNLLHYAGDERGIAFVRKAMKLDPFHPTWFHFAIASDHHFERGEYEEALAAARKIDHPRPLLDSDLSGWRSTRSWVGTSEAQSALEELLRLYPGFTIEKLIEEWRKWNLPDDSIRPLGRSIAQGRAAGVNRRRDLKAWTSSPASSTG